MWFQGERGERRGHQGLEYKKEKKHVTVWTALQQMIGFSDSNLPCGQLDANSGQAAYLSYTCAELSSNLSETGPDLK